MPKYTSIGDLRTKWSSLSYNQKLIAVCSYYAVDELDEMFEDSIEAHDDESLDQTLNYLIKVTNENPSNR